MRRALHAGAWLVLLTGVGITVLFVAGVYEGIGTGESCSTGPRGSDQHQCSTFENWLYTLALGGALTLAGGLFCAFTTKRFWAWATGPRRPPRVIRLRS